MNIELLDASGNVITVLTGVQHPVRNFELYWKHQFGAASFRETSRDDVNAELVAAIRRRRNSLLAASDWTVLPDSPLGTVERAAWVAYRTALRDLMTPTVVADYRQVSWPTDPNGNR